MSYKEFVNDLITNRFEGLDKQISFRDVPDTQNLHPGLLLPIESKLPLLLKKIDHTILSVDLKDVDGVQFNWPVNDSEGYLIQKIDGSRLLLKKEKAFVPCDGGLEPCSYLSQNAFAEFVFQMKIKFSKMDYKAKQDAQTFQCPIWVNRSA